MLQLYKIIIVNQSDEQTTMNIALLLKWNKAISSVLKHPVGNMNYI